MNPQEKKDPRAFFRGYASSPSFAQRIPINNYTNFNRYYHRAAFVELSNQKPDLIYARLTPKVYDDHKDLLNEVKRRLGV